MIIENQINEVSKSRRDDMILEKHINRVLKSRRDEMMKKAKSKMSDLKKRFKE